jgi:alkylation response protein AidB-like acyl-CoA dehydrogenase
METSGREDHEGMRLDEVQEIARSVAAGVVRRHSEDVDRDARWPEEGVRALQAAGLAGLVVPRSAGGLGHGLLAVAKVCEILGAECASTSLCFGMHWVGSAVIASKATEAQVRRYLVPICAGTHLTTLALSEPGSGAHFYFPQTRLSADPPDGLRVNGSKAFVTSGGHVDSYVVSTAAAAATAPIGEFSCVVVPAEAPGLAWGAPWDGLGMRGNASRSLELRDARISAEDLLGRPGDQIWYVFHVVTPYFLCAMAGAYLGVAAAAFEAARGHLLERHHSHSGRSLHQISLLQHRLGEMWAVLERTRQLVHHAAAAGDAGAPDALAAIFSAKAEAATAAVDLANDAMTLTGGIGYRGGSRLGQLLRDARAGHVMAPTTDLLRLWTGRALLGVPLLGE